MEVIAPLLVNELLPRRLTVLLEYSTNVRRKLVSWIPNFTKHQRVDKPGSPILPGWDHETTPDNYEGAVRIVESLTEAEQLIRGTFNEYSANVPAGKERKVEVGKERKTPLSGSSPIAGSDQIREVFDYWRERCNHQTAQLDNQRSGAIRKQLKSGRSIGDLKVAIDGASADPFSQGANDRSRKFDDITLICRDAEHVERFIEFAKAARIGGTNVSRNGLHQRGAQSNRAQESASGARGGPVSKPTPAIGRDAGLSALRESTMGGD